MISGTGTPLTTLCLTSLISSPTSINLWPLKGVCTPNLSRIKSSLNYRTIKHRQRSKAQKRKIPAQPIVIFKDLDSKSSFDSVTEYRAKSTIADKLNIKNVMIRITQQKVLRYRSSGQKTIRAKKIGLMSLLPINIEIPV